ncbi:hypothetical protein HYX03_00505 [Candidatus Woesearchaeota archaeon]|nr:hypothetical protein [Candidatus Woesearchaeota archaeon]
MKGPMRVYYDEEGDFLEISIGNPTKCYASEVKPGVFLRIDETHENQKFSGHRKSKRFSRESEEVKSIGIIDFKKRTKNLQDIKLDIPVEVNFSHLVSS